MAFTKTDLQKALGKQNKQFEQGLKESQKNIIVEISKFLEKHVLEPIFSLKKDVKVLKKDVREIRHEVSNINRRMEAVFDRDDRQDEKLKSHEKRISQLETVSPATI